METLNHLWTQVQNPVILESILVGIGSGLAIFLVAVIITGALGSVKRGIYKLKG